MDTIESTIITFKNDNTNTILIIENTDYILNNNENRKAIHKLCNTNNLFSKSSNDNNTKIITITKSPLDLPIIISDEDKATFLRDYKLPITITKDPYFTYFINLYDDMLSTKHKYGLLVDAITKLHAQ